MENFRLMILAAALLLCPSTMRSAEPARLPAKPTSHTVRQIEGWSVRVDDRLLKGEGASRGELALKLLAARLLEISLAVPEKPLAKLREVTIQLDLSHGDLRAMQYHPDRGWLLEHGYSAELAKCVHIPEVGNFTSPHENRRQPWAVMHELAHAYHHQALGFDDARIIGAWKKFRDSGRYKSVLTVTGGDHTHYALTNEKEFFAEMTESYFGVNDFYPFVAGELKQTEPELFQLLREVWGSLPQPGKRAGGKA